MKNLQRVLSGTEMPLHLVVAQNILVPFARIYPSNLVESGKIRTVPSSFIIEAILQVTRLSTGH